MERFLIVKTSAIGDVIQALPVAAYLKERFPGCQVDWVVEKGIAPLLSVFPLIDSIYVVDTKKWRGALASSFGEMRGFVKELRKVQYDALFDLQANTKSGIITAFASARKKVGYSWNHVAERPNVLATNIYLPADPLDSMREKYLRLPMSFFGDIDFPQPEPLPFSLSPHEEKRLTELSQIGLSDLKVMVCFGSRWENKQLDEETLISFLERVKIELSCTFLFVYGNEEEKTTARKLEAAFFGKGVAVGELSLSLWQNLMKRMDLVLTTDSAALHLVGTTETPSFSFFGPSSPHVYLPAGKIRGAFTGKCPYGVPFEKRCPKLRTCETGACLRDASPDDLFTAFQSFWRSVVHQTLHFS